MDTARRILPNEQTSQTRKHFIIQRLGISCSFIAVNLIMLVLEVLDLVFAGAELKEEAKKKHNVRNIATIVVAMFGVILALFDVVFIIRKKARVAVTAPAPALIETPTGARSNVTLWCDKEVEVASNEGNEGDKNGENVVSGLD